MGGSDEKLFRPVDVAEPIGVLILHDLAHELRTVIAEPFQRLIQIVYGEHDAEVAQSVDRSLAVIRDNRWRKKAGELKPAVAVRRAHYGDDALTELLSQA